MMMMTTVPEPDFSALDALPQSETQRIARRRAIRFIEWAEQSKAGQRTTAATVGTTMNGFRPHKSRPEAFRNAFLRRKDVAHATVSKDGFATVYAIHAGETQRSVRDGADSTSFDDQTVLGVLYNSERGNTRLVSSVCLTSHYLARLVERGVGLADADDSALLAHVVWLLNRVCVLDSLLGDLDRDAQRASIPFSLVIPDSGEFFPLLTPMLVRSHAEVETGTMSLMAKTLYSEEMLAPDALAFARRLRDLCDQSFSEARDAEVLAMLHDVPRINTCLDA